MPILTERIPRLIQKFFPGETYVPCTHTRFSCRFTCCKAQIPLFQQDTTSPVLWCPYVSSSLQYGRERNYGDCLYYFSILCSGRTCVEHKNNQKHATWVQDNLTKTAIRHVCHVFRHVQHDKTFAQQNYMSCMYIACHVKPRLID